MAVGLALEARALLRPLPRIHRQGVTVAIVGPGAVALGRLDAALAAGRPHAVLVAGVSGGCAPGLRTGDIVVGDPVGATGPASAWRRPDAGLRARAMAALGAAGLGHRAGRLLTVDSVVATPAEKAACWTAHGALAVDMESSRVLAWAEREGIPALAVRAVADGPGETLPRALLALLGPGGRLRPAGVAALVGRPALIGAAWRLGRRSRRALGCLAHFLQAFLAPSGRP